MTTVFKNVECESLVIRSAVSTLIWDSVRKHPDIDRVGDLSTAILRIGGVKGAQTATGFLTGTDTAKFDVRVNSGHVYAGLALASQPLDETAPFSVLLPNVKDQTYTATLTSTQFKLNGTTYDLPIGQTMYVWVQGNDSPFSVAVLLRKQVKLNITAGGNVQIDTRSTDGSFSEIEYNPPSVGGGGGLPAMADGQLIYGVGGTATVGNLGGDATIDASGNLTIADDAVTTSKIAAGTTGQVLTTDGSGDVVWAASGGGLPPMETGQWIYGVGGTATVGTMDGDATIVFGNLLISNGAINNNKLSTNAVTNEKIADGAVTTSKIADDAVTVAKIAAGSNGQVLTTDGSGDVVWAAVSSGTVEAARISGTTPQAANPAIILNSIYTAIDYDTIPTSASLLNGYYTPQTTGVHHITGFVVIQGNATGFRRLTIRNTSFADPVASQTVFPTSTDPVEITVSADFYLVASQNIFLRVEQTSGVSLNVTSASLSGRLVGAPQTVS